MGKELKVIEDRSNNSKQMVMPDESVSFAQLLDEYCGTNHVVGGSVIPAHVLSVNKDFVLVDVKYKSEGLIPTGQFPTDENGKPSVHEGDCVDVFVEACEDDSGHIVLSKEKADHMKACEELAQAHEQETEVEGTVVGRVRGGLQIDVGVPAFLPASHLDVRPVRNLDDFIGQRLPFRVVKFNRKRGNVVLSRRLLLEKDRASKKRETLATLQEGAVLEGIVKNVTEYGAFIDLGGIDGLLHVTDMSWGRVQDPNTLFCIGDTIRVKVLSYDQEREKISLGVKQIEGDPWDNAFERFPVGKRVCGKVVSLIEYGAFIELSPGIEGLIHVSEMSWSKRVKHPSQLVQIGDEVEAVVLDVDRGHRRISLGMKQATPNPWELFIQKYPIGTVIKGQVSSVKEFGIFIGIEEGIDGLVHVSDLSWTKHVKHPSELFKEGDEVEAVVLNVDPQEKRFALGIKQLTEDPWSSLAERYPRGSQLKGKVTKVIDFGAFIEIEPGIEGLCHVSEFARDRVEDPHAFLKQGDEVEVMVIDVDTKERQIGLSIRAVEAAKEGLDYRAYLADHSSSSSSKSQKTGMGTLGEALKDKLGDESVRATQKDSKDLEES
ncbi:MAG: 30S ribosomal protein S1 [Myxococcota bacterium]